MKYTIVCIRDSASESYGPPQVVPARGSAIRGFQDAVNTPGSSQANAMHDHPEDFELYAMGTFDDFTGTFEISKSPELLMRGKDAKKSVN